VKLLTGVLIFPSLYYASERIDAARTGPVLIDRATCLAHKWTTQVFMLLHPACQRLARRGTTMPAYTALAGRLEGDDWQTRPRAYVMRGVAFEELA